MDCRSYKREIGTGTVVNFITYNLFIAAINTTKLIIMKTTYTKLFRLIAKILDRILFAFKMFPTKNPTTPNWLYSHRIASTAYPDGTRYEYVGSININDLKRKKVKI